MDSPRWTSSQLNGYPSLVLHKEKKKKRNPNSTLITTNNEMYDTNSEGQNCWREDNLLNLVDFSYGDYVS